MRYPSFQIHQTFFYSSQLGEPQLKLRAAGEGDLSVASQEMTFTIYNVREGEKGGLKESERGGGRKGRVGVGSKSRLPQPVEGKGTRPLTNIFSVAKYCN
jgi:hypothetical protein